MITLTDGIIDTAEKRGLSKASQRRVYAALRTLERELGALDFHAVTGHRELAQKVCVPGDPAVWIVVGEWDDGSMDLIREEGSFSEDMLVGWVPGQSLAEYRESIHELEVPRIPPEKSNVRPLFRSAPKRRRT